VPSKVSVVGSGTAAKSIEKKNGSIEKAAGAPLRSVTRKLPEPGMPVKSR
jgi:hypothetical protein